MKTVRLTADQIDHLKSALTRLPGGPSIAKRLAAKLNLTDAAATALLRGGDVTQYTADKALRLAGIPRR